MRTLKYIYSSWTNQNSAIKEDWSYLMVTTITHFFPDVSKVKLMTF